MRISSTELEYTDLEWFAVDKNHKILRFTSGGYGAVPEFVCASWKRTELLSQYFENLPDITEGLVSLNHALESGFFDDYIAASQKGLYCFDAFDGANYTSFYTKITSPGKALYYDELPLQIQELIKYNFLQMDADRTDKIMVTNAD